MRTVMRVLVIMVMMRVAADICALASVVMLMVMLMREMHIELHPLDTRLAPARDVQVIPFKAELLQLLLQPFSIQPQINERADKHVATDPAENIQIQGLHY